MDKQYRKAALKALADGRLWWRVTDQHGRPCNGGDESKCIPAIGEWAARVKNVSICSRGYHVTMEPHRWMGCRVWLVEIDKVVDTNGNKAVCHTYRPLAEVDPYRCVDVNISKIYHRAYLHVAELRGSDLRGAYLQGAELRGAYFQGSDLRGTDLRGADLQVAYLQGTDLRGADLRGAYLQVADLRGADLRGADLQGADLRGAYHDHWTVWPSGFELGKHDLVKVD